MQAKASHSMQISLNTGNMTLSLGELHKNWSLADLFSMAQRQNPRRPFLFVSKVLGRHIPQSPAIIRQAFTDLANEIPTDLDGPILIMGMAETAVGLAAGVHQVYSQKTNNPVLLLTTTRHSLSCDLLCQFEEEHSHATRHLVHLPDDPMHQAHIKNTKTLILVDDEATTGKTFANLYLELKKAGLSQINRIITVTLTDWSNGEVHKKLGNIHTDISLLSGQWTWQSHDDAPMLHVPTLPETAKKLAPLNDYADLWGRRGVTTHTSYLTANPVVPNEHILVLGSGEYVWQPFLLADSLEQQGAEVKFGATTRSPIALGNAIQYAINFHDNYGMNVPMYVYNVVPEDYDRVILCSETAITHWDPTFIQLFPNLEFIHQ